jgi:hypothetical protein
MILDLHLGLYFGDVIEGIQIGGCVELSQDLKTKQEELNLIRLICKELWNCEIFGRGGIEVSVRVLFRS